MQALDNIAPDPVLVGAGGAPVRAAVPPSQTTLSVVDLHPSADRLVLRLTSSDGAAEGGSIELPLPAAEPTAVTLALSGSDDPQGALLRRALREGPRRADDPATRLALIELPLFLAAPGDEIFSTAFSADDAYAGDQGTSMAAAYTSGAAALLRAAHPTETPAQIIGRLVGAVDPLPALMDGSVSGGRLNLRKALGVPPSAPLLKPAGISLGGSFVLQLTGILAGIMSLRQRRIF